MEIFFAHGAGVFIVSEDRPIDEASLGEVTRSANALCAREAAILRTRGGKSNRLG